MVLPDLDPANDRVVGAEKEPTGADIVLHAVLLCVPRLDGKAEFVWTLVVVGDLDCRAELLTEPEADVLFRADSKADADLENELLAVADLERGLLRDDDGVGVLEETYVFS